jgi:hypothetical protein
MEITPFAALLADWPYAISVGSVGFNSTNHLHLTMDRMMEWCHECFERENFCGGFNNIYFRNERDRTLFLLKWS